MSADLYPRAADRLAKVCALLTSNHDGERANAAALATRLLTDCGLTWQQLVERAFQAPPPAMRLPVHASHVAEAHWALRFPERLTNWERKFLADIGWRRRLSAKQAATLDDIVAKLRMGGCA